MAKIVYENLKSVKCQYCGEDIKPTGPNTKNCSSCLKKITNIQRQVSADMDRFAKFGTYDMIGKGGRQLTGSDSPHWKGDDAKKLRIKESHRIRVERLFCEVCGINLLEVGRGKWAIHHINRDQSDQSEDNLQLLCKRCHQLEHDCIKNLEPATTITYTQASGSGELCCEDNIDDIV